MFNKILAAVLIVVTQEVYFIASKTLPTNSTNNDVNRKSPTTSYYRHNIFGPNTYAFGFEVNDKASGNIQFRDECRYMNGTTKGSYGYVRPDGSLMVTHFLADSEVGYLSQTQNFQPGDEPKWQENWPTRKPNILKDKPLHSMESEDVVSDVKSNLTSILLPVKPVREEHGIDLNPPELEKELINPAVLEIINGEAPLISDPKKKDNSVGFETINKFIPAEFPIVPFELPSEDLKKIYLNEGLGENLIPVLNKTKEQDSDSGDLKTPLTPSQTSSSSNTTTYIKSKENNKKNSIPPPTAAAASNESNSVILPTATSTSTDKNTDWYDKFINQTRQDYLEIVH